MVEEGWKGGAQRRTDEGIRKWQVEAGPKVEGFSRSLSFGGVTVGSLNAEWLQEEMRWE
jgi:hypothetical protein